MDGIKAVEIDNSGNLWIAGSSLGKFDGVNWTFDHTQGANVLAIDKNSGILWKGTGGSVNGTLSKFNGSNWITFQSPYSGCLSLAIDSIGNVWIATFSSGLIKFNGTNWTVYNSSNSGLPNDYLASVTIDGNGNIWVGTSFVGLTKFDGNNWTNYFSTNSGLPDNHI